ncbi:uncharacterized protein MELLADRAFT_117557 [Melampsora larici-populina 98AG31]|uniref:Uncharacterized protein n=1 Tax=Melampsora larici-populina (strain 98AG31 / pathotype 3-4-7) TaxID=747676 RepID=F4RYS2_MELLP|nr:uncharacterized protein MELLADRAFT_117557 [Melampsora larici-populina 98AG31]EGG02528.1 hypothetical protein MELLADRAFT_117557 [Melampsora larici-populina 98AG31]
MCHYSISPGRNVSPLTFLEHECCRRTDCSSLAFTISTGCRFDLSSPCNRPNFQDTESDARNSLWFSSYNQTDWSFFHPSQLFPRIKSNHFNQCFDIDPLLLISTGSLSLMSDWDDLFGGDDMNVDDEAMGGQPPRENALQPSSSAMSLSGSSDSPQPAPATLFRPPQPRNTPASAPPRQPATRTSVNKFSDLLKLTKENQVLLQKMCEHTMPGEEYVGTLSYLVFLGQESKGSIGGRWVPGKVIRDAFKDQVAQFISRPELQAFSKSVAEDHTTMVQSLEVLTFNFLKGLKPDYIDEHGPGDYVAGEACIPTTAMYLFIKEILKNQRSKVRSALLNNILGVAEGSALKVPAAKSMVFLVTRLLLPEVRALPDEEMLGALGRPRVKRVIFMRYVTAFNYLNHTENKKRCQCTLMDEALAELRTRPARDSSVYFNEIARYDRETFTGKRTWAAIKASGPLRVPFVEQVLAAATTANGSGGSGIQGPEEEELDEEPSEL